MTWRLAESLDQLRGEINLAYPGRPTQSDGTIGDAAHSSRTSDHNPNSAGVVCALDITNFTLPTGQELNDVIAEHLRTNRDSRIKYVISKGRMFSSYATNGVPAWTWRPYSGLNGHFHHVHISVAGAYDNRASWGIHSSGQGVTYSSVVNPIPVENEVDMSSIPIVQEGTKGQAARNVQGLLIAAGRKVDVDGDFGPKSVKALKEWQKAAGLVDDGICGPKSYGTLLGAH